MRDRLTGMSCWVVPLMACALLLGGTYFVTHRGIGYGTPEAAATGFYKGLQFENAAQFVDPEIRDTPEGEAMLSLYDPTQFSGHFSLYGERHAGEIDEVDLKTIDVISQTQTMATLHVSGRFDAVADLGTVVLHFGPYAIDDTVHLAKVGERWFVRSVEVHAPWFKE